MSPLWRGRRDGSGAGLLASLRLRIGIAVLLAVSAFATSVVWYSTSTLSQAEGNAAASTVLAIARTFGDDIVRADALGGATMETRLLRLRELNPDVLKVSVYAVVKGRPVRAASTNLDGAQVERHHIEPLATGVYRYTESNEDGRHVAELNFPIRDRDGAYAVLGVYYDLAKLDTLHAKLRKQLAMAGATTALLLTLLLSLVLGRGVFRPLSQLRTATRKLAEGELATRLAWRRRDEIGALAEDFDNMAFKLERSHTHLETLALRDAPTGLDNHRSFKDRVGAELARARREEYSVALVALDVDQFKDVNDRLGHPAGDQALCALAEAIRESVRPSDISGRLGGDEFAVALPRMDAAGAEQIVGRIRQAIEAASIGTTGERMTISAGIAEFPTDAEDEAELSRLADGALYRAKRSGRDRAFRFSREDGDGLSPGEDPERIRSTGLLDTVHALARAVDEKDGSTHLHPTRVALYAAAIANSMGLASARVEHLKIAGALHDVGKIGISDGLLLKKGPLNPAEFEEMKRHSVLGRDIIAGTGMSDVALWVAHLHERMDGTGYPDGLAGGEIPLESRILAVADAFEAMMMTRSYRPALSLEDAVVELQRGATTQFDPEVVYHLLHRVQANRLEDLTTEVSTPAPVAA